MPRPEQRPGRKGVQENPLVKWIKEREKRLRDAREEAARLVTDKLSENERAFIRKLEAINFRGSKLPESEKAKKTDPEQRYCDLEYAAMGTAKYLREHPQTIKMDIRGFDEKLMTLILLFKQAVEHGDVQGAYTAKGGIIRAVTELRSRMSQEQPEPAIPFVKASSVHLEQWNTLTWMAIKADRRKENIQSLQKRMLAQPPEEGATEEERRIRQLQEALLQQEIRHYEEQIAALEQLTQRLAELRPDPSEEFRQAVWQIDLLLAEKLQRPEEQEPVDPLPEVEAKLGSPQQRAEILEEVQENLRRLRGN